jgi:hypothetical protein
MRPASNSENADALDVRLNMIETEILQAEEA